MLPPLPDTRDPRPEGLGWTLRSWRAEVQACCDIGGTSNGGTEAIGLIIEQTRRLAHRLRNFSNCRIGILFTADGIRPWRRRRRESG